MRRYFKVLVLMLACLAVLIPYASKAPDGLEKVAEILKIEENEPLWKGLMPDYILSTVDDPYISKLLAGGVGTILVFAVAFIVGMTITKRKKP